MRVITNELAAGAAFTPNMASQVTDLFSSMAAEWTANHDKPEKLEPLRDALARGVETAPGDVCVEVGSGTGLGTRILAEHFDRVVALDRTMAMLAEAPATYGPRVHGDASRLPVVDASVDVLVHVNMFLFPAEVDRVLAPRGALVWVNTSGESTPIHLTASAVHDALPGEWHVTHSRAGTGTWAVATRTP